MTFFNSANAGATGAAKIRPDFTALGDDGYVTAEEVLFLRRNVYPDGVVDRDELQSIFALGERAPNGDPEWRAFFAEAAADYFLNEEEPRGYLTDAEFEEVKALVTRDGARASSLELGLLVALMERATTTPPEMGRFVCDQIRRVISQKKPTPSVSAEDADLISRALYAAGGDGAVGITKIEAELLYDVHDMTAGADNDPVWTGLFARAIAAHLMMHVGYAPVERTEALRLHAWASDRSSNPVGLIGRALGGLARGKIGAGVDADAWAERNKRVDAATVAAEAITLDEADWLADRIGRNGAFDETEKALLRHLKGLDAQLPPKLQALADRA